MVRYRQSKSLIFLITFDDQMGPQPGIALWVLYVGLDDASDTLPKVSTAHREDRDGTGKKGRYSLHSLRGQN